MDQGAGPPWASLAGLVKSAEQWYHDDVTLNGASISLNSRSKVKRGMGLNWVSEGAERFRAPFVEKKIKKTTIHECTPPILFGVGESWIQEYFYLYLLNLRHVWHGTAGIAISRCSKFPPLLDIAFWKWKCVQAREGCWKKNVKSLVFYLSFLIPF